jgi:hypothetical protein
MASKAPVECEPIAGMAAVSGSALTGWPLAWATAICPRLVGASFPIQVVTVERTVPQAVNLSQGVLPSTDLSARMSIVRKSIVPQFSIKFAQLAMFRELKFSLDALSPSTAMINTPIAWGITNVPAQSAIYAMAIGQTYKHHNVPTPDKGGLAEFVRLKIMPGIWWTFLREGFATGGGMVVGPMIKDRLDELSDHSLPSWSTRFLGGLTAGYACAFATILPHNCALTAARMAAQGEKPTTLSCFRTLMQEQGLIRALYVNFPQRCAVIATVVACLNTANVNAQPELSLASVLRS